MATYTIYLALGATSSSTSIIVLAFHNILGLHNVGGLAVVQQHIEAVYIEKLSASAAFVIPTAVGWFVPNFLHAQSVLQES